MTQPNLHELLVTYVYARDITEPGKIIDVLAAAKAELG
jgi:hypothetical protein